MPTENNALAKTAGEKDFIKERYDMDAPWFNAIPGEAMRIRLRGDDVRGHYTVIESVAEPMAGPPLHSHLEDEVFSILEGMLTIEIDGQRIEAGPGTIVVIPAGSVHAWRNFSGQPVRFSVTFSPGGIEGMFEVLKNTPIEQWEEVAGRYGSAIFGPPIER